MKRENVKKMSTYALFYGSLWGITEATLGHLLHTLPVLISGSIMFPIAISLMYRAYISTGSRSTLIFMGVTAAVIKLVDIFIPGLPAIKTLNPMIAIMLEATAVTIFITLLNSNKILHSILAAIGASLLWRTLFVTMSFFIHNYTSAKIGWVNSSERVYSFIVMNGLVSAVITFLVIQLSKKVPDIITPSRVIRPIYAGVLFLSASFIQYVI